MEGMVRVVTRTTSVEGLEDVGQEDLHVHLQTRGLETGRLFNAATGVGSCGF